MKVDPRVHSLIPQLETKLKELKKVYRDPTHQPPKSSTYRDIWRFKRQATILYSAIAASRGRVHRHGFSPEQQAADAEKLIDVLKVYTEEHGQQTFVPKLSVA